MDERSAFERRRDEGNLLGDVQVVIRKPCDEESFGRTTLKDQIGGPVVIDELADVAAFLI